MLPVVRIRRILTFALLTGLSCTWLVLPAAAVATAPETILKDWRADKRIDGTYSLNDLRAAQTDAQSDELEYSSLKPELDRAIAEAASSEKGGGGLVWVVLIVAGAGLVVAAVVAARRGGEDEEAADE